MKNLSIISLGDCFLNDKFINSMQLKNMSDLINTKDILTLNLETVISDKTGIKSKKSYLFKSSSVNLKKFKDSIKIPTICNIANNHILDYGMECYNDTLNNIDNNKLLCIGHSKSDKISSGIQFLNVNGYTISFIGAFMGYKSSNNLNEFTPYDHLTTIVKYAKKNSDFVIVNLHWGEELSLCPNPNQIKLAHKLIDNGADAIIGHHPHVPQGIELYKKKIIAYSLGNFNIIQNHLSNFTNYGYMLEIKICSNKGLAYNIIPYKLTQTVPYLINNNSDELNIFNNILKISNYYINNNTWFNFFVESSTLFIKDSFDSWKIRQKKGESITFSFIKWILHKNTILKFIFYYINKIFKTKINIYNKILNQ